LENNIWRMIMKYTNALMFFILIMYLVGCKSSGDILFRDKVTDDINIDFVNMYIACNTIKTKTNFKYTSEIKGFGIEYKSRFGLYNAFWISGFGKVDVNGYIILPTFGGFSKKLYEQDDNYNITPIKSLNFNDFILNNNKNKDYLLTIIKFIKKYKFNEVYLVDVYKDNNFKYSYLGMVYYYPSLGDSDDIIVFYTPEEKNLKEVYEYEKAEDQRRRHEIYDFEILSDNIFRKSSKL